MTETTAFTTINFKIKDAIAEISLNRPDVLNAINNSMLTELNAAMDIAEADPSVRAILIHGNGRAFSAGFDLKESALRGHTTIQQWRDILTADFEVIMRFWDSPKPTVAAVHGHCVGGGFEVAMACDVTLAAESARLGEPEVKFGSGIVALLLPWLTGPKQAKELLLSGEDKLTAARAHEIGLLNRVVDDGELLDAARRMASSLSEGAAASVRFTKLAINRSYDLMGMRAALMQALELDIYIESSGGPEREEFNRIRRESGLKAAIDWREGRHGGQAPSE